MTYSIIIILLFTTLLFWKGFEKTSVLFLLYNLVDPGVSFIKVLNDKDVVIIIMLLYILIKRTYKGSCKYPFIICTILSSLSYIISTYYSSDPHMPVTILTCLEQFSLPYFFFLAMRTSKMRHFFINNLVLFSLMMGFYVIIELISQSHPIPNYFITLGSSSENLKELLGTGDRYGIMRCMGTFQNGSGLAAFGLYSAGFMLFFVSGKNNIYKNQHLLLAAVLSCVFCIFVSGFRSGIALIVVIIAFRYLGMLRKPSNIFLMAVIAVGVYIIGDAMFHNYFNEIFQSIVHSDQAQIGSSQDMRETQYDIGIYYFLQSPIIGHGTGYTWNYVTQYNPEMYGAESIWLPLMIEDGIIGCIAYFLWYIYCYRSLKTFYGLIYLVVIIALNSMTSTVGINMSTWVSLVIVAHYIIKQNHERNEHGQVAIVA